MKTILLLLLSVNCFSQQKEFYNNRIAVNGITVLETLYYSPNISVFVQAIKGDQYIDLKINIPKEKIIGPVFIETRNGKFSPIPIQHVNKNGYSILRLFYRLKHQWVSIDSGITFLIVKTTDNVYRIPTHSNLSNLKNYTKCR